MSENTLKRPADDSTASFQDEKRQRIDTQDGTNYCTDSEVSDGVHCTHDEQDNMCSDMDEYEYTCRCVRCHDTASAVSSIDSRTKCLINQLNERIESMLLELHLADQTRHDTKVEHNQALERYYDLIAHLDDETTHQKAIMGQNDIYIESLEAELEYQKKGIVEYQQLMDREASEKQRLIFAIEELKRGE